MKVQYLVIFYWFAIVLQDISTDIPPETPAVRSCKSQEGWKARCGGMRGERKAKALGLKSEMKALATGMRMKPLWLRGGRKALRVEGETISLRSAVIRATERIVGSLGKYKCGADRWRGSGGTPPGNFEILHALRCVLGASEALFWACIQYINTYQLPSSFSGFHTTYGALVSDCAVIT